MNSIHEHTERRVPCTPSTAGVQSCSNSYNKNPYPLRNCFIPKEATVRPEAAGQVVPGALTVAESGIMQFLNGHELLLLSHKPLEWSTLGFFDTVHGIMLHSPCPGHNVFADLCVLCVDVIVDWKHISLVKSSYNKWMSTLTVSLKSPPNLYRRIIVTLHVK